MVVVFPASSVTVWVITQLPTSPVGKDPPRRSPLMETGPRERVSAGQGREEVIW